MKNIQNLKILKDPILMLSIFSIIVMVIVLDIFFLLFGILYFLTILIGINVVSKYVVPMLLKFAVSESVSKSKSRYDLISIPKKFQKHFEKGEGLVFLIKLLLRFNFLALLLIIRYFGLVFEANFGVESGFILAMVLSSLITLIVTPLSLTIFVLEGSIYREFNPERITLDFPASLFRRIIKSIFGYGNLVALVWLAIDIIQKSSDIAYAITLFVLIVLMAIASISFGSFLALMIDKRVKPQAITKFIEDFEADLGTHSVKHDDWITKLKEIMDVEETEEVANEGNNYELADESERYLEGGGENEKEEEGV